MFLYYAITVLHVIVCIILVLVVLLQSGKGADLAGAFGGAGSQTAFGSRGPASFLSKMTTVAAVVFMLTSISLSMITSPKTGGKSILETGQQERAKPVEKAPKAQPPSHIPTREEINQEMENLEKKEQNPPTGNQKEPPAAAKPSESK